MTDHLTAQARSENMARIRSKNTLPEMAIRRVLFAWGYRYRIHGDLPGKPDIVFPTEKVAVFCHGCYFHRHGCSRTTVPATNVSYWRRKFERNRARDAEVQQLLADEGWRVVVLWECDIRRDAQAEASKVARLVDAARAESGAPRLDNQ